MSITMSNRPPKVDKPVIGIADSHSILGDKKSIKNSGTEYNGPGIQGIPITESKLDFSTALKKVEAFPVGLPFPMEIFDDHTKALADLKKEQNLQGLFTNDTKINKKYKELLDALSKDVKSTLQVVDGVLFQGGEDVDPRFYGEPQNPEVDNLLRDLREFSLYYEATKAGVPVIGICRGMQLAWIANGGKLDKTEGHITQKNTRYFSHKVKFTVGPFAGKAIELISLHQNVCTGETSDGCEITAKGGDPSVAEAFRDKHGNEFYQPHPEFSVKDNKGNESFPGYVLFGHFVQRVAARKT